MSGTRTRKMETEEKKAAKRRKKNFFVLHSTLEELCSENEFTDVTIQVDNRPFKTHRFMLAALSEYFHAMFRQNFKEGQINNKEPIILHDVDAEAFDLILRFMYSGEVKISHSNVCALFATVDFLKLRNPYIEEECTEFIRRNIHDEKLIPNAIEIFKLACVTKKLALINPLRKHICQHLYELLKKDTLQSISYEDIKELLQQGCPFWIYKQDVVLSFLIQWVYCSRKERKHFFKELIKLVNLKKLSLHWISFLSEKLIDLFEDADKADDTDYKLFFPPCMFDSARSQATITFVKGSFSYFDEEEKSELFSPVHMIQNLPWRLKICRTPCRKSLGFFLQCDGHPTSKTWSCFAKFELIIVSQNGDFDINRKTDGIFSQEDSCWGYKPFIQWVTIINPKEGYIKDDTVVFQVRVMAEPPVNL